MVGLSKRMSLIDKSINPVAFYQLPEALSLIRKNATAKFNESVDIAVQLGVDVRKSDQVVRGSVILPHGKGRLIKIAAFAQGEQAISAKKAGADFVGFEDLADDIRSNRVSFDVVVSSPDAMRIVGSLGQILGPRGMMPNIKMGTVTSDLSEAIRSIKAGKIQYRTDKFGIVHTSIGRASFSDEQLQSNLLKLVDALKKSRPSNFKGIYFKKFVLSSTMGRGICLEMPSFGL